jgi:general secretion pathway protein J
MANHKPASGFTLIEVLIAMTLLSVMVALLFGSMKLCADSWQKGETKIADVNSTAVVYQFFQHHLTTAIPLWDDFSDENRTLSFQGHQQSLQFVSAFPASAKKSGLQLFSLKLMDDDEGKYLQVSIKPFFPIGKGEEWQDEEVTLLNHVSDFSVSYFAIDEMQPEGTWQDEWVNMEAMPRLVKIKIALDNGNYWPEMIFEIKSTTVPNSEESLGIDGQVPADSVPDPQ